MATLLVAAIVSGAGWYRVRRMSADLADKRQVFAAELGKERRVVVHPARYTTAYVGTIAEVVGDGVQLRSTQSSIPFNDIVALTTTDLAAIAVWGANRRIVDAPTKEFR